MAIFAMADLHLDVKSNQKSMEVFGNRWKDYVLKIQRNWNSLVSATDTVVIPGDISWALNLEGALHDLKWIDSLPGKKILMKGNHDFWWSTVSKMEKFFSEHKITTIELLNNRAILVENYILAGSRGWFTDRSMQNADQTIDYEKIINREIIRLRMSLESAKSLQKEPDKEFLVFLHFPPVWSDFYCEPIVSLLKEYEVKRCYFGHIHGCYTAPAYFDRDGIRFSMISSDYLNFIPQIL